MKFQSQFRFLVCVGILSGCSQAAREPYNSGGGGGKGPNNFNLKPAIPPGANVLGVQNVCNQAIWVTTPPNIDNGILTAEQLVMIAPGKQFNYDTITLKSLKLHAKFGCDSNGNNCTIGQQYNPCPTGGCPGAMDTGFEADNTDGNTYYDISLVDGFTAPMKVVTFNGIGDGTTKCGNIDASNLSIAKQCPTAEDLSTPTAGWASSLPSQFTTFGNFTFYTQSTWVLNPPQTINLQTPVGLQAHAYNNPNQIIACLSPGHKLVEHPEYGGFGVGLCQGNQCNSTNTVSGTPPKKFPDIAYSTNPPATPAVPAAYDARLVMYLNPYNGCDLSQGLDSTKPNGQTNCQGKTPVNYSAFASPQNTLTPPTGPFGFTQLIAFCKIGAPGPTANYNTSSYCNDYVAANTGIPVPTIPNRTDRSTAAAFMGRLGPIVNTNYVKTLHAQVPGVYTWQYDDAEALNKCSNTSSKGQFKMVVQIGCPVNQ